MIQHCTIVCVCMCVCVEGAEKTVSWGSCSAVRKCCLHLMLHSSHIDGHPKKTTELEHNINASFSCFIFKEETGLQFFFSLFFLLLIPSQLNPREKLRNPELHG